MRSGTDCSILGARCSLEEEEHCEGKGASCDKGHVGRCEGEQFVSCLGGRVTHIPCPKVGKTCGLNQDQRYSCINRGDCESFSDEDTCEGSSLRYCGLDGWEVQDCLALGFSGCGGENQDHCLE